MPASEDAHMNGSQDVRRTFRPSDEVLTPWTHRKTISMERAARILDVSKQTIGRMIEEGELKAYKARPDKKNSPWRISYDSLLAHMEKLHSDNGLEKRF
jgi:excisionase family DNA binding protein